MRNSEPTPRPNRRVHSPNPKPSAANPHIRPPGSGSGSSGIPPRNTVDGGGKRPASIAKVPRSNDPGARPMSARQRELYAPPVPTGRANPHMTAYQNNRVLIISPARDPQLIAARRIARKRNRRYANIRRMLRGLLFLSLLALIGECYLAFNYSPRFWVRDVIVTGNSLLSTERLIERLNLGMKDNLLRLPIDQMRRNLETEPAVSHVELRRLLPHTLQVIVQERKPLLMVQSGNLFYTLDSRFIPFQSLTTPVRGLPLLKVIGKTVVPGKPFDAPGLNDAVYCINWATAHPDFPLDSILIDPDGKLCLNRNGGMRVQLGSGGDLEQKLTTLALLIARRLDLRDGTGALSINLYAFDAPSVDPRPNRPENHVAENHSLTRHSAELNP